MVHRALRSSVGREKEKRGQREREKQRGQIWRRVIVEKMVRKNGGWRDVYLCAHVRACTCIYSLSIASRRRAGDAAERVSSAPSLALSIAAGSVGSFEMTRADR